MKFKIFFIVVLFSFLGIFGCNFDTLENERVVGNYWIETIDLPQNRMLGYSKSDDGSYKEIIVTHTVVKIEWNDKYVLVSRNPVKDISHTYLQIIRSSIRDKEIKRLNLTANTDSVLNSKFKYKIDSLAEEEFSKRKKTDLKFLENPNTSGLIIWYLFVNNEKSPAKIFLTIKELNNYMDSLGIKDFKKVKEYK